MGKQIRFFMGPEDEKDFISMILKRDDLVVMPKLKEGGFDLYETKCSSVDFKFYIISSKANIISKSNGFINETQSDVIEFIRPRIKGGFKIEYGRLWIELKYWNEQGELIGKDKRLSEGYDFYRQWIKNNFRISKDKHFYIAEQAYKLYLEGKMQMISPPKYVVEFD